MSRSGWDDMSDRCKTCCGNDYFQKDPDCKNCPVFTDGDCEGSEHNPCVIRSVCPNCNGTGKEPEIISKSEMKRIAVQKTEAKQDEIRLAFKEECKTFVNMVTPYDCYESGYKSATQKAQAEIEELKESHRLQINDRVAIRQGLRSRIKELEQQIENMNSLINNIENCLICADIGDNREIIENSYSMITEWKQK